MAELVYALVSKTSDRKVMRVRFPLSAQKIYSTSPNTPQLAAGIKAKVEPTEAQTRNEVKFLSVVGLGILLRSIASALSFAG